MTVNKENRLFIDSLELTYAFDLTDTVRKIKLDRLESEFVLYHVTDKDSLRNIYLNEDLTIVD